MSQTPIQCEIDLAAEGRQTGYLRLPHSVHRSAYGFIPIPVACIANGEGPSVLVMAGNHGDEYEGQIVVSTLIRELESSQIRGRLILLPMANFPAAEAGLRVSPLDGANLNRCFPGDPTGTVTQIIAHYIEHELLARVDTVFDLHSGGSSLAYAPTLLLPCRSGDPHMATREAVVDAFALPQALFFRRDEGVTYSSAAALRQGVCPVMTELGGTGTVSRDIRRMAMDGVKRSLAALGLLDPALAPPPGGPVRRLSGDAQVFAGEPGLYEPLAEPGEEVAAGQPAALIHRPETPGRAPVEIAFDTGGLVLAKRVPARVIRGDCLFHLGLG